MQEFSLYGGLQHEVHVFLARPEGWDHAHLTACEALLSAEEKERAGRYHFDRDRRLFVATRALVRTVLSRIVPGVSPSEWGFVRSRWGRPEIDPRHGVDLELNASHATEMVAVAVARARLVGVDVEHIDRARGGVAGGSIADATFSTDELRALRALPADRQAERFLELWTLKEAFVKARAMGFSLPLERFGFDLEDDHVVRAALANVTDDARRWAFSVFWPTRDHALALAYQLRGAPVTLRCFEWSPSDEPRVLDLRATRSSLEVDK